jgi:hypothetical protein
MGLLSPSCPSSTSVILLAEITNAKAPGGGGGDGIGKATSMPDDRITPSLRLSYEALMKGVCRRRQRLGSQAESRVS